MNNLMLRHVGLIYMLINRNNYFQRTIRRKIFRGNRLWPVWKESKRYKRSCILFRVKGRKTGSRTKERSNEAWKIRVRICIFIRVFLPLSDSLFLSKHRSSQTKPSRIVDEFRSKLKLNRLIRGRIGGLPSLPFNFIARPTFFSLLALHDRISR